MEIKTNWVTPTQTHTHTRNDKETKKVWQPFFAHSIFHLAIFHNQFAITNAPSIVLTILELFLLNWLNRFWSMGHSLLIKLVLLRRPNQHLHYALPFFFLVWPTEFCALYSHTAYYCAIAQWLDFDCSDVSFVRMCASTKRYNCQMNWQCSHWQFAFVAYAYRFVWTKWTEAKK